MLVNELKETIKKYNDEEKTKIIIELYKKIPKRVKEDYDIDNYIVNLDKKVVKEEKNISFADLEKEVKYFLECANNGLYASGNKIISKEERKKWRFKVKKYYKELNKYLPDTLEGIRATDLLKELYVLLSYSTNYLTFSNWETFRAIQISQGEFLETIAKRKLSLGLSNENVNYCISLLDVYYDPYDFHRGLLRYFESCLKTIDAKNLAIDLLKEEVIRKNNEFNVKNGKSDYEKTEKINYLIECIFDIYCGLSEVDKAIDYFNDNYIEKNKEIKKYVLLDLLEDFDLYEDWILEYEKYIGKIDYRSSLKEKYNELKSKTIND